MECSDQLRTCPVSILVFKGGPKIAFDQGKNTGSPQGQEAHQPTSRPLECPPFQRPGP